MTLDTQHFLDTALRIGRRLAGQALWQDGACTWQVMSPDREHPGSKRAVASLAGGAVYEGSGGIALFLGELAAVTGDAEVARAALAGVEHALREGAEMSDSSFGFHAGRPGIAYAAVRVGRALDRPGLFARAEALLRPLAGNETRDPGMDVIAGGGGAIPALLAMAGAVDAELATGMARRLGDHLIAVAARDADGFSWGAPRSTSIRNLCGYAHGAAGIGHGLLELYAATGAGEYRYAAEQAFLYERRFFSPEHDNWPDLRHTELGEYLYEQRLDELRDRLRAGNPLRTPPTRYMSAWCHGAPGIGLPRLRAWQLLGDPVYLDEARAAMRAVEASLTDAMALNYSLCHGRGGNCDTLMEGARVLGEPALLQPAADCARAGIERYEEAGVPWPCGTLGGVSDPGLLLGEAGIGMFLLRLARPDVPSPLFVTAPDDAAARGGRAGAEGYARLQAQTVAEHVGRTMRLFRGLGVDADALAPKRPMGAAPAETDVEAAFRALAERVEAEADPERRALLEDAMLVDRARMEVARAVTDFTQEYVEQIARTPMDEVEWRGGRVSLSSRARVAATRWDWDAWAEMEDDSVPPAEDEAYYLAQCAGGRPSVRRLSPFAALVLQSAREPVTVDEVIDAVAEAVSGGGGSAERGWLEDRVVEQLAQAYRAGFVDFEPDLVVAER
jgi:lantibiotic biosynthesis protein